MIVKTKSLIMLTIEFNNGNSIDKNVVVIK